MSTGSLVRRLMVAALVAGALIAVILLFVVPSQQTRIAEAMAKEQLHDIGGALAVGVEYALRDEQLGLLGDLNTYLSDNPTISMAGVFADDGDGLMLLAEFPEGAGIEQALATRADTLLVENFSINTDIVQGQLVIASERALIQQRAESLRLPLYAALAIITLLQLLLIVYLSRRVVRPVLMAADISHQLGEGRLDEPVPKSGTGDEIDTLLGSLDQLRTDLLDQRHQNYVLIETLEHKVNERTAELQSALNEKVEQDRRIWHMAHYDELTGLINRNLFNQSLDKRMSSGEPFVVVLTDINDFKLINDTRGHVAGDGALKAYSNLLSEHCGTHAMTGRLGGDEFAIILTPAPVDDQLQSLYEQLSSAAASLEYTDSGDRGLQISFGAARYPEHGRDRLSLMRAADTAMYVAKSAKLSGSAFAMFHPGMEAHRLQVVQLREDIERALQRGEFDVAYQPVWDLETGRLISCEALLRWPSSGEHRIEQVISVAEETGLIMQIGDYVMDRAIALALRTDEENPELTISFNVSPIQFRYQNMADVLEEKVKAAGVRGERLIAEITESTFIDNIQRTRLMLDQLNRMGVAVAIDDFGTGYSNLSVLHQFTVDWIKIDRSLIRGISAGDNSYQIVSAIVQMARGIDMQVVAEGVETLEEMAALRTLGCQRMQGYLLSKPIPEEAFLELLRPQRYTRDEQHATDDEPYLRLGQDA